MFLGSAVMRAEQERGADAPPTSWPRWLWTWLAAHPPPGPFRQGTWRSPLRGPWLTSVLGAVLLVGLPVVALTGLLSYVAYGPRLGQAVPADPGWLQLPYFDWPTRPAWLYRLTQGLHVVGGLALVPVVLAKLWSVVRGYSTGRRRARSRRCSSGSRWRCSSAVCCSSWSPAC